MDIYSAIKPKRLAQVYRRSEEESEGERKEEAKAKESEVKSSGVSKIKESEK